MGLTSEGRRYNPPHMLPAASPPTVEINGQPAQAYLSPKLQRSPDTPQGSKSALHTLLLTAALIFAAATVVYSCVWMYYVRLPGQPGTDRLRAAPGGLDNLAVHAFLFEILCVGVDSCNGSRRGFRGDARVGLDPRPKAGYGTN